MQYMEIGKVSLFHESIGYTNGPQLFSSSPRKDTRLHGLKFICGYLKLVTAT